MSKVSPRFLSCGHLNHWKPAAQTEAGMIYTLLLLLAPGSHEDDGSSMDHHHPHVIMSTLGNYHLCPVIIAA